MRVSQEVMFAAGAVADDQPTGYYRVTYFSDARPVVVERKVGDGWQPIGQAIVTRGERKRLGLVNPKVDPGRLSEFALTQLANALRKMLGTPAAFR